MEPISKSPWNEIGRGAVVAAPKAHPAWLANAALNNPTATATGAVATAGAASQAPRFERKRSAKKERAADVAAGAAVGAGAGLGADRAAFYALKREYKKKKYTAGQNGRSAKRELKELREAAAAKHPDNPRKQEHYRNANWPERFADAKLRRAAATRTGGKNAAILAGTGAALGIAGAVLHNKKEVKKSMDSVSAFGVDHGYEISKADKKKSNPSAGRYAMGYIGGPIHGLVAGKGAGGKAKSAVTQTVGQIGGATAAAALTRNPVASLAGGIGGSMASTKIAHSRGWLKPQKKGAV